MKVIPGEEVSLQHQFLVCDMQKVMPRKTKHTFFPRLKVWRLKDPVTCVRFQESSKNICFHLKVKPAPQQRKSETNCIMKTSPCNEDPLTPHFYIVKLGFTGVYIFSYFLLQNIDCGYS